LISPQAWFLARRFFDRLGPLLASLSLRCRPLRPLNIKLKSKRGEPQATDFGGLALNPMTQPADLEERDFQQKTKAQDERRQREEAQPAALREKKRLAEAAAKTS
jgi:hypothetical protein